MTCCTRSAIGPEIRRSPGSKVNSTEWSPAGTTTPRKVWFTVIEVNGADVVGVQEALAPYLSAALQRSSRGKSSTSMERSKPQPIMAEKVAVLCQSSALARVSSSTSQVMRSPPPVSCSSWLSSSSRLTS